MSDFARIDAGSPDNRDPSESEYWCLMSWTGQLRRLSFRTKVVITVLGAGFAVLGASTYLSFAYWQDEARSVAEQQALLAAHSTRLSIENAFNAGDTALVQRVLTRLVRSSAVTAARIYDADNRVVLASDRGDVAQRRSTVWIPAARELPRDGTARLPSDDHNVHAFVPLGSKLENVLEVEFSMSVVQTAMQRGARLGLGLLIVSLLVMAVILYAMVQRELVAPFQAVEKLAEERRVLLEERAGFAEVGELAAEMAHEFKRPLASIRSAMQLLEQEYTIAGNGQALLTGIEAQLERLSDTMRDVFGLARPIGIDVEELDLTQVLDSALMQVSAAAQAAGVTIVRDYPMPVPLHGDARRLELAFVNLFNNAIDAMTSGGTLTVYARPVNGGARVEVRDTGIGIEPSQLQNVMRPFFSTKSTGTGLGLPLVARVVRAHHGELHMESSPGKGTTVFVTFGPPAAEEENTWQAHAS